MSPFETIRNGCPLICPQVPVQGPLAGEQGRAYIDMMEAGPGNHRPYVVAHLAVSLDGSVTGFAPDQARFYSLAAEWHEDATLAGADTILAQAEALSNEAALPGPDPTGPVLAVVDSRYRVTSWKALRLAGHWSRVLALRGEGSSTGPAVDEIATGGERVNLAAALAEMHDSYGVRRVRLDSGGTLVGAMLGAGLVDEVSLLVHPVLVTRGDRRLWWGEADPPPPFSPAGDPEVRAAGGGLVQLRYRTSPATGGSAG